MKDASFDSFLVDSGVVALLNVRATLIFIVVEFCRLERLESDQEVVGDNNVVDVVADVVQDLAKFPPSVVVVGFCAQPVFLNCASVCDPCCNTFF